MNFENNLNIKKEKKDEGYDKYTRVASTLPKPIAVKEEICNKNNKNVDNDNISIKESEKVIHTVKVKKEPSDKLDEQCILPKPVIVKVQPNDSDTDIQDKDDELDFLDEIDEEVDEIISVAIDNTPINIDDDDEEVFSNKRKIDFDSQNSKDSFDENGSRDKHKQKRKLSGSPVENKPDIKKLKESLVNTDKYADPSNVERFPRKVFNYNHSSVPREESVERMLAVKLPEAIKIKVEPTTSKNSEKYSNELLQSASRISMDVESNELQIAEVLKNCSRALKRLQILKSSSHFFRFNYTPTKLVIPINDETREYRSPLLRSNNVKFKFSTSNPNISYNEFNIESPSENITKISKLLGLEIGVLKDWINNFHKNQKIDRKPFIDKSDKTKNLATFYTSISTQTVDIPCNVCLLRSVSLKEKLINVAVEAKPDSCEIGIQVDQKTELPIIRLLENLNANQLLALNDFTVLLCEQDWETADSSTRLNIRDKLLQYFQEGQKPCSVPGIKQKSIINTQSSIGSGVNVQDRAIVNSVLRHTQNRTVNNIAIQNHPMVNNIAPPIQNHTMVNNIASSMLNCNPGMVIDPRYNSQQSIQFPQYNPVQHQASVIHPNLNVLNIGYPQHQSRAQPEVRPNDPRFNRNVARYRQ